MAGVVAISTTIPAVPPRVIAGIEGERAVSTIVIVTIPHVDAVVAMAVMAAVVSAIETVVSPSPVIIKIAGAEVGISSVVSIHNRWVEMMVFSVTVICVEIARVRS
jgi:hypothetical protein